MNAKLRVLRGLAHDLALVQRTVYRATKQKNEFHAHLEEARERSLQKAKDRALAPMWAKLLESALAADLGGGDFGKKMAAVMTAIGHDLPLPDEVAEGTGKSQSNPVKPEFSSERQVA
jgi:hypothetical protein